MSMFRLIESGVGIVLGITLAVFATQRQAQQAKAPSSYYEADVIRTIDGDTIEADIQLGWGVCLKKQTIRLLDYDAWETSKRRQAVEVSDDELIKGTLARQELSALLASGRLYLSPGEESRDNYGRPLARGYVSKPGAFVIISEFMRSRGHQRPVE